VVSSARRWYLRAVTRAFLGALTAFLISGAATTAQAYEDQASIDAELAYVHAFADSSAARNGFAIGAGASFGLSNVLTVRGQLMWAFHPSDNQSVSIAWLSADLVYVIDVLEIVPYFGAGLDGAGLMTGSDFAAQFGIHPVIGFDYLLSRALTVGVQVKPVFVLTALDTLPVYLQAGITLSYLFDP
jgi:hypothetical protein